MAVKASGRFVPPSAFAAGIGETFTGAYAWNAPREAVGRERPLTRDEMRQVQGVLSTINRLPYFLRSLFTSRYDYIRRNKSPVHGFYFLTSTFQRRLWPRIERVNQRHEMNTDASLLFLAERDHYARLPRMNDKELKKFAARISSQLFIMYEELCDAGWMRMARKNRCLRMRRRLTCMVMLLALHVLSIFPRSTGKNTVKGR